MRRKIAVLLMLAMPALAMPAPVATQSEWVLKDYFEGRMVRSRIDMPATNNGVDIKVDERQKLDFGDYQREIKSNGVGVKAGETIMVTKVRVKGRHIEFQLGGGGFGTLFDDDGASVWGTSSSKTQREKDLERDLKKESDPETQRRLAEERDALKKERQREDERNRVAAEHATEVSKMRVWEQRGQGGSRFNIRFRGDVPRDLMPETVIELLSPYLEFTDAGVVSPVRSARREFTSRESTTPSDAGRRVESGKGSTSLTETLRKGLTREEVDRLAGTPSEITERREAGFSILHAVYLRNDYRVDAEFVEGLLVRYTLSVK